jgi:hypothetical protein
VEINPEPKSKAKGNNIQNSERKKNPNILNPIQREINSKILWKKTQAIGAKKNLINPKSWLTSRSAQESEMQRMVPSFGTS